MSWENEARDVTGRWIGGDGTDAITHALRGVEGDAAAEAVNAGRAPNTKTLHTDSQGRYSPEREALHRKIIDHFMSGTQPHSAPQAIFTAGGAASGKSGLAGRANDPAHNLPVPRGHVYVNPDEIKAMLPEYQGLRDAGKGAASASATHEESSDIAKALTAIAMQRHRHLVIDGTGNARVGKFGDKLRAAKANGYKVTARYAHIPVETAIERERGRAARTGRKVIESVLRNQHQTVSAGYRDDVQHIPGIKVEIVSTAGRGRPTLIADKPERGPVRVRNKARYQEMLNKAGS
jgi:predicted ABC-type ATPase